MAEPVYTKPSVPNALPTELGEFGLSGDGAPYTLQFHNGARVVNIGTSSKIDGGEVTVPATSVFEIDLGPSPQRSGWFWLTGAGLSNGQRLQIEKAPGPYRNKGTLVDEAEMDLIIATPSVVDALGRSKVFWNAYSPVCGWFSFYWRTLI